MTRAHTPTQEQLARWKREAAAASKFHVTYFQVVYDERVGTKTKWGIPLSPRYATEAKARAALRGVLRHSKAAKAKVTWPAGQLRLTSGTVFFSKDRPEDVRARRAFIAELQ